MIHVFRMHKYVRIVRTFNKIADTNLEDKGKLDKDKIGVYEKIGRNFTAKYTEDEINQVFSNTHNWLIFKNNIVVARYTCKQAKDNDYIARQPNGTLEIIKDGHDFANWPFGLIQALLDSYGKAMSFVLGILASGFIATVWNVLNRLLN